MKVLIVIDMQNDFIDGVLGTREAQAIVPLACEKIKNFKGAILLTADTHNENYLNTQEGKFLPVPSLKGRFGSLRSTPAQPHFQEFRSRIILHLPESMLPKAGFVSSKSDVLCAVPCKPPCIIICGKFDVFTDCAKFHVFTDCARSGRCRRSVYRSQATCPFSLRSLRTPRRDP